MSPGKATLEQGRATQGSEEERSGARRAGANEQAEGPSGGWKGEGENEWHRVLLARKSF